MFIINDIQYSDKSEDCRIMKHMHQLMLVILVCLQALKEEIKDMHGIRIFTDVPR